MRFAPPRVAPPTLRPSGPAPETLRLPTQVWTLGLSESVQREVGTLLRGVGIRVQVAEAAPQCPAGAGVAWLVAACKLEAANAQRLLLSSSQAPPPMICIGGVRGAASDDHLWPDEVSEHLLAALQGRRHLWTAQGLQVSVLGKPQALYGGVPVSAPQKSLELLYHLLALPHADNARRMRDLWPQENDRQKARNKLHTNVHRLRNAIGQDAVQGGLGTSGYRLRLLHQYDAEAYRTEACTLSSAQLSTLVELYQPYLTGMDAPWIEAQRIDFQQRHYEHWQALQRTAPKAAAAAAALRRDPFMDIII